MVKPAYIQTERAWRYLYTLLLLMDDVLLRHTVVYWQTVLGSSDYARHEQNLW